MSKMEENQNELVGALKNLILGLKLLLMIHKTDSSFVALLGQVRRLVTAILEHRNTRYLKATYFIVSDFFCE